MFIYGVCAFGFYRLFFVSKNRGELWTAVLFLLYFFDNLLFALMEFVPEIIPLFAKFDLIYPYVNHIVKIALMLSYRMIILYLFGSKPEKNKNTVTWVVAAALIVLTGFADMPWGDFAYMATAFLAVVLIVIKAFALYRQKACEMKSMNPKIVFWLLAAWSVFYLGCYITWFAAVLPGGMSTLSRNLSSELLGALCTILAIYYLFKEMRRPPERALSDEEKMALFVSHYNLTRREAEILLMLLDGDDNLLISKKSYISPNTVKVHVHNIYQKLGIQRRTQIVKLLQDFKK